MRTTGCRTFTKERDEALYKEYERVITSYGDKAKYLAKSILYEEAAKPFFISAAAAKVIINKYIRNLRSNHDKQ